MISQLGKPGLLHDPLFLQTMILEVVFQSMEGNLNLLDGNLAVRIHVLDDAVQLIDQANQPLVIVVEALDAYAQIVGSHQNHGSVPSSRVFRTLSEARLRSGWRRNSRRGSSAREAGKIKNTGNRE